MEFRKSQITLNRNNLNTSSSLNNIYSYVFNQTAFFPSGSQVAVSACNLYFSWFNISQVLGNNTFTITHPEGAGNTTINITIPDGYYTIAQLNSFIQSELISNGLYLLNGDGDFVYYVELISNITRYSVQLNAYEIPTSLPSGWSNPASYSFPVSPNLTPTITLPVGLGIYLGFSPGTYPATTSTAGSDYSVLSNLTPRVDNVQSIVLRSNLVNNTLSNPTDVLYSFSPVNFSFGSYINNSPNELLWVDLNEGYYQGINIELNNQDFNAFQINDSDVLIQIVIKVPIKD